MCAFQGLGIIEKVCAFKWLERNCIFYKLIQIGISLFNKLASYFNQSDEKRTDEVLRRAVTDSM